MRERKAETMSEKKITEEYGIPECPRCGKPALHEVTIHAALPYDHRTALSRPSVSFSIAACNTCAVAAAREAFEFLKQRRATRAKRDGGK